VFAADFMEPMKTKVEETLGVKLLSVMYLGRRQLNLRTDKEIKTPADLAGIKLRMPGPMPGSSSAALGANPVPMAFTEVYTGLQTGAIDGQDNPLPTNGRQVLRGHQADRPDEPPRRPQLPRLLQEGLGRAHAEQQATVQKAADDAAEPAARNSSRWRPSSSSSSRMQGLKVYEPRRRGVPQRTGAGGLSRIRLRQGLAGGHGRPDQRALTGRPA
jgi:TRAP-type transport system periplasmic protein